MEEGGKITSSNIEGVLTAMEMVLFGGILSIGYSNLFFNLVNYVLRNACIIAMVDLHAGMPLTVNFYNLVTKQVLFSCFSNYHLKFI